MSFQFRGHYPEKRCDIASSFSLLFTFSCTLDPLHTAAHVALLSFFFLFKASEVGKLEWFTFNDILGITLKHRRRRRSATVPISIRAHPGLILDVVGILKTIKYQYHSDHLY